MIKSRSWHCRLVDVREQYDYAPEDPHTHKPTLTYYVLLLFYVLYNVFWCNAVVCIVLIATTSYFAIIYNAMTTILGGKICGQFKRAWKFMSDDTREPALFRKSL